MSWLDAFKHKEAVQQTECSYYLKCSTGSTVHIRDTRDPEGSTLCGKAPSEDWEILTSGMYGNYIYSGSHNSQHCSACVDEIEAIMSVA